MTKFLLLAVLFLATNAFGQETPALNQVPKTVPSATPKYQTDPTFGVYYPTKINDHHSKMPAFYLNGKLVNEAFILSLNPSTIESIDVVKDNVIIDKVTYYGSFYVKTKSSYNPKIISLSELKEKYLKPSNAPTIFIFDGELVTSDYDKYMVDEDALLRVIIDKVENKKEGINLNHITLLTKSDENIKKVNQKIRIRGTEM